MINTGTIKTSETVSLDTKTSEAVSLSVDEAILAGSGIAAITWDENDCMIITMDDGTQYKSGSLKGQKGDAGEAGPQGETGPKGDTGERGETGATGAKGDDGVSPAVTIETLTDGARITITDATGAHVFTISNGRDGEKGETGATGATGPQGPKGDTGDTGATGPQGPSGEDYVLTAADKVEIRDAVYALLTNASGQSF